MKRILVIGSSGSGKSTVARELGEILGLPVVHLDLLYWNPGWVETPDGEFDEKVRAACAGDRWIVDGNYGRTIDIRLERADAIVFLDLPRLTCIRRVLSRRGKPRPDLPEGCVEHRRLDRDQIEFLRWIWNYPSRSRPKIMDRIEQHRRTKTIYHLRDQASVDRLLDGLRSARAS